jgi:thiopeptide-type bacteriocin biosynthesis protein
MYWAARGLAERGHHVVVVTASDLAGEGAVSVAGSVISGGLLQVIRTSAPSGYRAAELARLVSQADCDVVVASAVEPYAVAGCLAVQRGGRPLLIGPADHECAADLPGGFVDGWEARVRIVGGDPAGLPDMLVESGVAAAQREGRGPRWRQFGLTVTPHEPRLYAALRQAALEALSGGLATEFFFMHKPPGMRLRYLPVEGAPLEGYLSERLSAWKRQGLIVGWRPGVYEPEEHLFGGSASMRSVHRVFTADSLAWLGYHGAADDRGPAWMMSLLMVRALLDALQIVGWEDRDVWDRVRRRAGRRLRPSMAGLPRLERLGAVLSEAWSAPDALAARLPGSVRELVASYRESVMGEGKRWFADCFEAGLATAGPREVAAFMIVFHWNRGGFGWARQALVTEALLMRGPGERW